MKKKGPELSNYLFWDSKREDIDYDEQIVLVLERVFSMGTENDEREVIRYYGIDTIKENAVKIKVLDPKTVNYLSITFEIPKRSFLCYLNNVYQKSY
jgi:hypothetical protein